MSFSVCLTVLCLGFFLHSNCLLIRPTAEQHHKHLVRGASYSVSHDNQGLCLGANCIGFIHRYLFSCFVVAVQCRHAPHSLGMGFFLVILVVLPNRGRLVTSSVLPLSTRLSLVPTLLLASVRCEWQQNSTRAFPRPQATLLLL